MAEIDLKSVNLDDNWTTPAALADELGVARSTVTNWIKRKQIDFVVLPGAVIRRHMVDRRSAPVARGRWGHMPKKSK